MPNPKKKEKKQLTLDDLARMVQEGFAQTVSDFNELDTRLDARITGLDRKMDAQYQEIMHELKPLKKLPNLEADFMEHERRIKALEKHTGIGKE